MRGQLLLLVAMLGSPPSSGLLVLTTPSGMDVWVDGTWRGQSPLVIEDLKPGVHRVRVGSRSVWSVQPLDTLVTLGQGITHLQLTLRATAHLTTEPHGATIEEGGVLIGHAPLVLSRPPGVYRLLLRRGNAPPHLVEWAALPGTMSRIHARLLVPQGPPRRKPTTPLALSALACGAMAASSAVLAREADEAYRDYASTAHPDKISRHYRRARRLDRWASGLWIGFEIGALGTLVWWIAR